MGVRALFSLLVILCASGCSEDGSLRAPIALDHGLRPIPNSLDVNQTLDISVLDVSLQDHGQDADERTDSIQPTPASDRSMPDRDVSASRTDMDRLDGGIHDRGGYADPSLTHDQGVTAVDAGRRMTACAQVAQCDAACASDVACRQACIEAVDFDTRRRFANFLRCTLSMSPDDCGAEYEACFSANDSTEMNVDFDMTELGSVPDPDTSVPQDGDISPDAGISPDFHEAPDTISMADLGLDGDGFVDRMVDASRHSNLEADAHPPIEGEGEPLARNGTDHCLLVHNCWLNCDFQDNECEDNCIENSTTQALRLHQAYLQCLEDSECQDSHCVSLECYDQRVACLADGDDPNRYECSEFHACINACGRDGDCENNCVSATNPSAILTYDRLVICSMQNALICDGSSECLTAFCADELATCFDHPPSRSSHTNTCGEMLVCIESCPRDDSFCQFDCKNTGTNDAQRRFTAWSECDAEHCIFDNCSYGAPCGPLFDACLEDGLQPGTLTCNALYDCIGTCGDDWACQSNCNARANPTTIETLDAYQQCFIDAASDCPINDYACRLDRCEPQSIACFGYMGAPVGVQTCGEFNACLHHCAELNGGRRCTDECVRSASSTGYNQHQLLADCNAAAFCHGDADCLSARCSFSYDECRFSASDLSCSDYRRCWYACEDTICQDHCDQRVTLDIYYLEFELWRCGTESGCLQTDNECLQTECSDLFYLCLWN